MSKMTLKSTVFMIATVALAGTAFADHHGKVYGPFPVTVKDYKGKKDNSVSYSGQIARHVLHDSLKKLAGKGDGGKNAAELEAQMLSYFNGSDKDLPIIAPAGKDGFKVKQKTVNEISKGKNISGKFYNGAMPAWPGNKSGKDVVLHMIKQASMAKKGFDAENGYDWGQLISKFTMGAMMYNQAVDNYLDEKLSADKKPNNKPYKDGAAYTGKEHSWDEAFGYWGAPAHTLSLSAKQAYGIAKQKDAKAADANGDGMVDLKSEFVFGPAYYAAGADKGGKTNYLPTIMTAFFEGRKLITSAKGEALSDEQRNQLKAYAATIESNWEKVLAEATFKYAGSVYKDIDKMAKAEGEEKAKAYRTYVKHWGELKGFAMALQTGKNNLGETAVELNKLVGFGPVTMDNTYVTGVDANGNFERKRRLGWKDYKLNMLKAQKLISDKFGVEARTNDATADLAALAEKINAVENAETD
ncbi:MAG: DUF4856 domain-containing protein [Cohaesibacter sp.]|nr:DUF4856 domain-containing protein [Cohaesibacter sp.]MCV6602161.1 DUF4856 domain-containing protein [Cohaesibacter sp.]